MILVHWLASGPDPFGQNLTQSARTKLDLGWFFSCQWKNTAESETETGKLVVGWLHSVRTRLADSGHNGHNQNASELDLAYLQKKRENAYFNFYARYNPLT